MVIIKVNDLRIGNLLLFDNVPSRVTLIGQDSGGDCRDLVANGSHHFVELSGGRIKGIKLTNDILIDAGFVNDGKISDKITRWTIGNANFILFFTGDRAGLITSLPKSAPIFYLHQLQNIYYSLLDTELDIKNNIYSDYKNLS